MKTPEPRETTQWTSVPQCWCKWGVPNLACPWFGVEYVNPRKGVDSNIVPDNNVIE